MAYRRGRRYSRRRRSRRGKRRMTGPGSLRVGYRM